MNHHTPPSLLRPDPLRLAILLCLFAPPALQASEGLQPSTGPGGTPIVSDANGVPVVNIVPPNATGLSHNQYQAYNVDSQGLVLNNALQAGQSVLTGSVLQANPQFHGQAAAIILNEVISRQASLIQGPQEILGRPADYILANPNGITINGGSFINNTQAGFLVGTPVIEDQRIKYLDTLNAEGILHVQAGGLSNLKGALDLIAPRVHIEGPLKNEGVATFTLGRNRIDAASGEVLQHLPGTPSSIDARLFGAMRAGRIRVISTAEGAGVQVGDVELFSDDELSISSAGDLEFTGTQAKAKKIKAKAGQKLVLNAKTREQVKKDREAWDKRWWFVTTETYSRDRTQTDSTQQGTALQANEGLSLDSGGDLQMTAAKLKAGTTLALHSEGNLDISAGVDSSKVQEQVRHRKHLWRGDSDSEQYTERANGSSLEAGNLTATAGKQLKISASNLSSQGDMQLQAAQVEVGEQAMQDSGQKRDYRGDLVSGTFFGDRKGNDTQGSQAVGSTVRAEGKLTVSADSMAIKGSSVSSAGDAVLYSDKAGLEVGAAQSTRRSQDTTSDSQLFGLLGSRSENNSDTQQVLVSDVRSSTNLRLASAGELSLKGAQVAAGQALEVTAKGDVHLDSAEATSSHTQNNQQRSLTASASQTQQAQDGKPGSRQYDAKVGYQVENREQHQSAIEHVASTLSGAKVDVRSDTRLVANAAQVKATAGDLTLKAPKVELNAAQDTQQSQTKTTISGGDLAVTGGIDRVGSAFEGHLNQTDLRESTGSARRSELSASGNLLIDTPHLATEGAKVNADGQLLVNAEHIENRAAADTHEREESTSNWQGSLGASIEYRDISRPIERLVEGREGARFQQAGVEDAMAPPSVGADATVGHLARTQTDTSSTAQPASFSGTSTHIQAGRIEDQGTQYTGTAGQLQIDANEHQLLAAQDQQSTRVQRTDIAGGLRVDTSTGEDINARVEGKYATLDDNQTTRLARPGSLSGQTGIQVQLGSDGRYEGTRMDGGDGAVKVTGAGTLTLDAAHDHTHHSKTQLDTSLWAKGGNRPGSTGADVRAYADHSTYQSDDSKAQVGSIVAKGPVEVVSSGDLTLEGTRIDAGGNINLHSDGVLKVLAANDSHEAVGDTLGGGVEMAGTAGTGKGGGVGGHATSAKVDENASQAVNAQFTAKQALQLTSLAREDIALQVQGLQANAASIGLTARNGGLQVEASNQHERYDNRDISAGAGFKLNRGETADQDIRGLHGRVQVALDKRDNQSWSDSTLRADQIDINSRGDTRIEGAKLDAERISGTVGGDLLVASRKDRIDSLTVNVDGRLSQEKNPQGHINAVSSLAGPAAGKVQDKAGKALARTEPGLSPTLKADVSHQQRDTVARQTTLSGAQGIDLKVGGDTRLVGAALKSAEGAVDLGGSDVSRETLSGRDYRRDVSFDVSNAPVDLGTAVLDSLKSKGAAEGENALDLGLLRTSGYDRSAQLASKIDAKP